MRELLEVSTRWGGLPAKYPYIRQDSGADKLVILFPGRAYPLDAPLMWYVSKAATLAGCDVLGVEYGYQANRTELSMPDFSDLLLEASMTLDEVVSRGNYKEIVFTGKSLGTVVQAEILHKLSFEVHRQVFLTPLPRVIPTILGVRQGLVIVGDRDEAFGAEHIAKITGHEHVTVRVVPGADHGLETDNPMTSVGILQDVTRWCAEFY